MQNLRVGAAANTQFVLSEILQAFYAETGIRCDPIISSSGKLTAQIIQGAPYDILISADMQYPMRLFESGLTTDTPKIYAWGSLILWTMRDDIDPSLEVLGKETIRSIAVPNPKTAPYGFAVEELFNNSGMDSSIRGKWIFGESVSQTNQFILSGGTDIGFTCQSVVFADKMRGKGRWTAVPDDLYTPIAQGAVIIKRGQKLHPHANTFYSFLYGGKARDILVKFGYRVASD